MTFRLIPFSTGCRSRNFPYNFSWKVALSVVRFPRSDQLGRLCVYQHIGAISLTIVARRAQSECCYAVEIHDSVLVQVLSLNSEVQLHFCLVYIHQSEGVPGVDAGSGWVQKAIPHIFDANVEGSFSEFTVDLGNGQTQIGQSFDARKLAHS